MRFALAFTILVLTSALHAPAVTAQEGDAAGGKTFKAELYHVLGGDVGAGLKVERLKGLADLGVWLEGSKPEKLQSVTVTPGQDNEVVKYKDLTFRISGLYRGAQKNRMLLKVSFDQGGQAAVKEFLAGVDESILIRYPMNGTGSVVVLLTPTG